MKKYCIVIILTLFSIITKAQIINGYTDKQSYRTGETIKFYLSGTSQTDYNLIGRANQSLTFINGQSDPVAVFGLLNMVLQTPQTNEPWKNGFGYNLTTTWVVPIGLKSGLYYLGPVPIIIKGSLNADVVIVCPTNRINAYSTSGGKSFYEDTITPDCLTGEISWKNGCNSLLRATTVSFLRPQFIDSANIGGFFTWFMDQSYNANVIADIDLENYTEIQNAKVVVIVGHSEYWTRNARLNFDRFVDSGKNGLILSGNSMWWQVRYEDDNYQVDSTKLTCYKNDQAPPTPLGCQTCTLNPTIPIRPYDNTCDTLLRTVNFAPESGFISTSNPSSTSNLKVKYSVIGSIGADISHGGWGSTATPSDCNYSGFHGFKIVTPNSPILNGTNLNQGDILETETGEFDTTIISNIDSNNDLIGNYPELNLSALGFYRGEIIAFERTNIPIETTNGKFQYAAIILFQKTYTSGKIINVNSNQWCSNYSMDVDFPLPQQLGYYCKSIPPVNSDELKIRTITKNMIDLLSTTPAPTVFTTPIPSSFVIKPNQRNVSYSICPSGTLLISPDGIYVNNGFKVDNKNDIYVKIENCTSCNSSAKNSGIDSNKLNIENKVFDFELIPNPTNGIFKVVFPNEKIELNTIKIYNFSGEKIIEKTIENKNEQIIDLSNYPKGVYFIEVKDNDNSLTKKIIKN